MIENILFIGGAGFIGSSIIKFLTDRYFDYNIFVYEPDFADVSRIYGLNVTLVRGLLSDNQLIESVIRKYSINKIVHLVSTIVPASTFEDYEREFSNVIFPTIKLMKLCSTYGIEFIYFSSGGTVYGDRKSLESFVETDPKEPISYYGLTKQMIENSIQFEHRISNLKYLIFRPSNPYGPGQNINGNQGLIAVSLGKILKNDTIKIWGDGTSIRDYIFIDDLASIVAQLIIKDVKNSVINIGSGKGTSIKQILNILKEVADEELYVEFETKRKIDVSNMILDNSLLNRIVDIEFTPLKVGITKFYNYEKNLLRNHELI